MLSQRDLHVELGPGLYEVLKRRGWIIRRRLEGMKVEEIASALRICEETVDRWWRVYRKHVGGSTGQV
jgi:transposase-like protein